jgi:PAS domain S-box-containing protein
VAFLLLGALLGAFVDQRRRLEAELLRYYEASRDLLATADPSGTFTRVHQAWERALGHSPETMCSRPFIEFIHPEDREATLAETAALANGSRESVGFRNRYRDADGGYRWLEWSAVRAPSEGVIHAAARDITVQREAEEQLADNSQWLEREVAERTRELEEARAETLQRLAIAAEYRDDDTARHTARVGESAAAIATELGFVAEKAQLLREAAPLHDLGKLAISDTILLKPGKLSAQEYEVMKTHAALGASLLAGSSSPVLQMAAVIAEGHHERWDGGGYPAGLGGVSIPIEARLIGVADAFDAMTSSRPYRPALSTDRALAEVANCAGTQFDPVVAELFLEVWAEHADAWPAAVAS